MVLDQKISATAWKWQSPPGPPPTERKCHLPNPCPNELAVQLQEGENSRAIPGRPYLTRVTATGYLLCAKHGASPLEKVG